MEEKLASRWTGVDRFTTRDTMRALYQAADIVVCPSIRDACPFAVLEAMACGIPVIASSAPGLSEIANVMPLSSGGSQNGILSVPPRDSEALFKAIHCLIESPTLRQTMSVDGRKRIQNNYDLEQVYAAHQQLIHNILHR